MEKVAFALDPEGYVRFLRRQRKDDIPHKGNSTDKPLLRRPHGFFLFL